MKGKKKDKIVVEIPYDPRENPKIEVYMYPEEEAIKDKAKFKLNERARVVISEIHHILKYFNYEPENSVFIKHIIDGKPSPVPVIYINNVLFSTIYNFDTYKFYNIMEKMSKVRDEYFAKLFKDIEYGFVVYPNETFLRLRNYTRASYLVSSQDFIKKTKSKVFSIHPYEEIPAHSTLVEALHKMGVPITSIATDREVKYKVLVLPERKIIEK